MDWIIPEGVKVAPAVYMMVVASAVLLIGFSKGGFGGGVGVLATPLFILVLPFNVALSMILPLLIVCDIFTLGHFPRDWHPRSFWLIAGGTIIGLGIGAIVLRFFARADVDGERWVKLLVGFTALIFCCIQLLRARGKKALVPFRPGIIVGTITGILCGITTMIAHAAGAIVSMFLVSQKLEPRKFVGTCARYYLTFNSAKVPLYLLLTLLGGAEYKSYITWQTLKWDLWLLPLCPVGVAIGAWLNKRLSGGAFTLIIYIMLAITGSYMIFKAL